MKTYLTIKHLSLLVIFTFLFSTFVFANTKSDPLKKIDNYLKQDTTKVLAIQSGKNTNTNYEKKDLSWSGLFLKTFIVLAVIIVLIYLIVYVFKKTGKNRMFGSVLPSDVYKILGTAPLSFNKYLTAIKFYDTVYLLAFSENEVSIIDKIEDDDKIADIENLIPYKSQDMPDKFLKLLKKNMKAIKPSRTN